MNDLVQEVGTGPGFVAFLDPENYVKYCIILIAATASGALLAFHPVYRNRSATRESVELSKTLIIYSVVGALIAIICTVNPSMAFVIFGIGGLMRFRTEIGASKNTGHAIMGTLLGLCWGLGLEMVAVLASIYFWLMILFLERRRVLELVVGGVAIPSMSESAEAYRKAIAGGGGKVLSHSKNFKKLQMSFFIRIPGKATPEKLTAEIDKIADGLRGTPDWPET